MSFQLLDTIKHLHFEEKLSWNDIVGRMSESSCSPDLMELVAMIGDLGSMMYLHANGCPWNEETCNAAAKHGRFVCLKYAIDNGCPWDKYKVCYWAAVRGHYNCLRYAHEMGGTFDEKTMEYAAMHDSDDCMRYLHENGAKFTERTVKNAAWSGKMACLRYAVENGGPLTEQVCISAIKGGQFEALKYVHERGAPITERTRDATFEYIHHGIIEYVYEHCLPNPHTNKCQYCALKSKQWLDIDWRDMNVRFAPSFRPIFKARRKIYQAMERAYIDPEYAWCIRRLKRQFEELQRDTL